MANYIKLIVSIYETLFEAHYNQQKDLAFVQAFKLEKSL